MKILIKFNTEDHRTSEMIQRILLDAGIPWVNGHEGILFSNTPELHSGIIVSIDVPYLPRMFWADRDLDKRRLTGELACHVLVLEENGESSEYINGQRVFR